MTRDTKPLIDSDDDDEAWPPFVDDEPPQSVCRHGVPQPCILGYPGCVCADEALLEDTGD